MARKGYLPQRTILSGLGPVDHDLILREVTPIIHLAGETDACPAGEHPARDSRPGQRMTVEGE